MSRRLYFLPLTAALVLTSCLDLPETANRTVSINAIFTGQSPKGYIPPGAILALRTEEGIAASAASQGKTYRAVVVNAIVGGDGRILVQAGAPAQLVVMDFYEGGPTTRGQLQLGLASVTLQNVRYPLHGADVKYGPLGVLVGSSPSSSRVATSGPEVQAPAGTIMTFQTAEPIYLQMP